MNTLLAAEGITLITFLALFCGVLVHILKQLIAARRNDVKLSLRSYIMDHRAETVLSAVCGFVFYLALPQVASMLPDIAKTLGFAEHQTVLSSFVAGFMGNSLADFLGNRAASLTGSKQGS